MSSDPILHSPTIAQVMLNFAASHGVAADVCLAGTDIDPAVFSEAGALITRTQEMRLIENLMAALPHIPAMGFELGSQYHVSAFGVWGFVLTTCRNMQEAIDLAIRYLPLSTAYCQVKLLSTAEHIGAEFDPSDIPQHLRQFLLTRDMATTIKLARQINLEAQPITEVSLSIAEPAEAERIRELCGVPVTFNATQNCIFMPRDRALTPLPTYNERLMRQMEEQCQTLMQQRHLGGISNKVRAILLAKAGFLKSADEIAQELNIAPRSLRRKLEAENTHLRGLIDETRQSLAEQLLSSTPMKVEELAYHLGYSEAASFTRAFRRWHTVSPGEYRKQHT